MSFGFQLVHARPSRTWTLLLSWLLFSLGLTLYFYASQKRHHENPEDRVMPTVSQMFHGMSDATFYKRMARPVCKLFPDPVRAVCFSVSGLRSFVSARRVGRLRRQRGWRRAVASSRARVRQYAGRGGRRCGRARRRGSAAG